MAESVENDEYWDFEDEDVDDDKDNDNDELEDRDDMTMMTIIRC